MKEIVLAADLGGTNLRMAAINSAGKILYRAKRSTPNSEGTDEIVRLIVKLAGECLQNVKEQGKAAAIAMAVPAIVNAERGIILKSPNLPALNGFRLTDALERKLDLTCVLENDANAAAIGEGWLGASREFSNSIMITLGTGVGGGIIIDGKILRGVDGTAGEVGHISVEPFGAACGCGSRGCVEQYSSASAVIRLARELRIQYPESSLNDEVNLSALKIYEAGLQKDELALEVFRLQGFYLGVVLAGLINIFNPEVIVIGGGAADGWDLFSPQMFEQIRKRAYFEPVERVRIVRALLGDDAGILGAAHLAFEKVSEMT